MSDARQRAALCERAVRAGGAVARDAFRGELAIETKADKNDLVTDADRETQQQVVHTIAEEFPEDPYVCEEDEPAEGVEQTSANPPARKGGEFLDTVPAEGPCWVVDPIDGTANFARGIRIWATSVAAVDGDETVAAATYLPAVQDIYTAGPKNATRNGEILSVSERTDPETFAVALVAVWSSDRSDRFGQLAKGINQAFGDSRRFGSFQSTLGFVASGELEAAVTTEPTNSWDTIAGVKLVRAAGGTVTDMDGDRWTHESDGMVASNGTAHDTLVSVVRDAAQIE